MLIFPFTDAHLYVYRCRAVDVKVFIEKRNNLDSSLIMTKLGTLRSQFMKSSVYKGENSIYAERRFSFPEIRLYLHATALLQHEKWENIRHKENINWEYPLTHSGSADIFGCMMREVTYMPSTNIRLVFHEFTFEDDKTYIPTCRTGQSFPVIYVNTQGHFHHMK